MSRYSLGLTAALLAGLTAAGCGQKSRPDVEAADEAKPAARVSEQKKPADVDPEPKPVDMTPAPKRDRLHQSFADATLDPNGPPPDVLPPVDRTVTDKSGPALYEQVIRTWDMVKFTSADGKPIEYTAELHTNHGIVKMVLMPEISPNHARNFIVLARLGYYDGLRFDRIHNEKGEGGDVSCVEAGCPLGSGLAGTGSLGYWMKDEHTKGDVLSHTAGVVGACRTVEADTAATKFYINLNEARFRDGHYSLFAKVIDGLDVVRTIAKQPTVSDPEDAGRARPKSPVIITKVMIHETVGEAGKK